MAGPTRGEWSPQGFPAPGSPGVSRVWGRDRIAVMPSLFRFLILLGMLGGLGYGAIYSLSQYVQLQPREITVTVSPDKFIKN
jgi:hypothetical protein